MISYIGGKSRMAEWIDAFIPKDIETYVEPFSGMFWVFFKMDLEKYPNLKTVTYNDFNSLNANLFRCIKDYDRLYDECLKYPCQQVGIENTPKEYSEMFNIFQKEIFAKDFVTPTDANFDVAAKYLYVLTQVFSGSKPETAKYMDYRGKYRCKFLIIMDKMKKKEWREHFDKITFVENLDVCDVIQKYDSPTTYFYLDPPYYDTEHYYSKHEFGRSDHERLKNCLENVKGMFSLSYYVFDELNEWFPKDKYVWETKEFSKAAAASKGKVQTKGTELLIMNYGLENSGLADLHQSHATRLTEDYIDIILPLDEDLDDDGNYINDNDREIL